MSLDLAALIDRLEKIEARLIKEESALLHIRCDVRDTMTLAKTMWDAQASEAMDGYHSPPKRQSFVKRSMNSDLILVSMTGKALMSSITKKPDSKTHPAQDPIIERTASIDQEKLSKATHSSYSKNEQAAMNYQSFQKSNRWTRFLRSNYFRKGYKNDEDGNLASESLLAINAIDDRVSTTFVIHPESKFKMTWDLIEGILIILQFLILPILLGFSEFRDGLPIFSGIMTCIFLISIFISLRTGVTRNLVLLMDIDLIVDSYLKSWNFFFDVITIFPYVYVIDAVVPASSNDMLNHGLRFICVLNSLRILKLSGNKEPWWYSWFLKKLRMKTKINAASVGIAKV
jgi:hypothetical protein